jgi:hypothetical protein
MDMARILVSAQEATARTARKLFPLNDSPNLLQPPVESKPALKPVRRRDRTAQIQ